MSSSTIENILAQVKQLPAAERGKLIALLTDEAPTAPDIPPSRPVKPTMEVNERTLEYDWLAQHRHEYTGQWIALKGNQLVAHGYHAKEVFAKAREMGVEDAFVLLVEDPDIPFVGV